MILKAINDTVESDELMLILLIFEIYFRMHVMNSSISFMTQRTLIIEKVMIEIWKFRAERQVADALNIRNDLIIISIYDLFFNLNVLIWRENNVNQRDKWIESFKLLNMNNEICKIELLFESIDFRSIVIKLFLIESIVDVQSLNDVESENVQSIDSSSFDDENQNLAFENFIKFIRTRRLLLRYQNFADIIVFLQDDDEISSNLEVIITIFEESSSSFTSTFAESRRKEINDLLKRQIFEIIIIFEVFKNIRIFNFRFVDKIKHSDISQTYEKFRLIVQIYNNHEKTLMLTQAFIIQRISQRIILVINASINLHLYLRNIIQIYTQSKNSLNRMFFIQSLFDLNFSDDAILRIIKLLYDVFEIEAHWFNTYHDHHKNNLNMTKSTYDLCLLFINQSIFELIKMQTNDTLMLKNDQFAKLKKTSWKKQN